MNQGSLVMLRIHTRNLGNVTVLCLEGRIVNGEAANLRQVMDSQSRASVIVLDLGRVRAVDASGLGMMLELRQQAESRGIRFKLMNATKLVSRIFEITRLDSVFEITSGVELWPAISRARPAGAMEFARCA
jgi:anti-sigma B factor antagonist